MPLAREQRNTAAIIVPTLLATPLMGRERAGRWRALRKNRSETSRTRAGPHTEAHGQVTGDRALIEFAAP